jgi:hypothetical protein
MQKTMGCFGLGFLFGGFFGAFFGVVGASGAGCKRDATSYQQ